MLFRKLVMSIEVLIKTHYSISNLIKVGRSSIKLAIMWIVIAKPNTTPMLGWLAHLRKEQRKRWFIA